MVNNHCTHINNTRNSILDGIFSNCIYNMHHILVTELESSRETTCKIMNLPAPDLTCLEEHFRNLHIVTYILPNNIFEVDVQGVELLTKLCDNHLNYKILGQSMAIEHTVIGGGTVKTQKLIWTLGKEL